MSLCVCINIYIYLCRERAGEEREDFLRVVVGGSLGCVFFLVVGES